MRKKITLRLATEEDAAALLAIYTPYITETTLTFECSVPTVKEFRQRIQDVLKKFPYYVAETDGHIAGYAYASTFRTRSAYDWTAETTVYIHKELQGNGIGSLLYSALEATLKTQGVLNLIACIAYPNPPSIAFHETMGFKKAGHFHKCGNKMGTWSDVVWMEKSIGRHVANPAAVIPFPDLDK